MTKNYIPQKCKKIVTVLLVIMILSLTPITYGFASDGNSQQIPPDVKFLHELKNFIKYNYVEDVSDLELVRGSIKGMVEALDDPYSEFYTPEAFKKFHETASGNYAGIGVVIIMRDNYITAVSVLDGSPAERAGMKAGDKIVQIDGKDVTNMALNDVSKLLRGEEGTKVEIGVLRNEQLLKFNVDREIIEINPIEYDILENGIGYLKISEFNEHTVKNLDKALNEFKKNGVKGIVLDLRNNPGGILDQAIRVATRFVPEGPIVHVVSKHGKMKTYYSKTKPHPFELVVLINGGSASASEIVAGAIKDRNVGTLVGETTFGKATVQRTLDLGTIGGVKLTIGRYTTPNGTDINKTGIKPDIEVKVDFGDLNKDILPLSGNRTLNSGYVGLDVIALQQRLKLLNLYDKEPDGIYDKDTQDAVKALQRQKGVFPTGVAGETFYKILDEALVELIESRKDAQLKKAIDVLKQKMYIQKAA